MQGKRNLIASATVPAGARTALLQGSVKQMPHTTTRWADSYILKLESLGLVGGEPDGTFDPNAPLTRAEKPR